MDTQPKIAICIPTILKDNGLMQSLNSILDVYQDNWVVLIGEQNNIEDYSEEKTIFYHTACAKAHDDLHQDRFKVVKLPYDCGLSYARNKLVEKAMEIGADYCVISADSIMFTESMKKLNELFICFKEYDVVGLELKGRISWEAYLDIQEAFVFDFIERHPVNALLDRYTDKQITVHTCDVIRNFFMAKTPVLASVLWDDNVKMGEHGDWFWRLKQEGFKVGFTDYCEGQYRSNIETEYKQLRQKNLEIGKDYMKKKYNLKKWHEYIHLERVRKPNV